ncbi:MAG: hypothetical protein M5U01_09790 [Ardenticatenaceae bacterium]|nr:hypothetical protein [Ardenticatenaceae bacterium]MCZ7568864.1 hypothetical protein [Ardenticatenaceae bacterium]
MANALERLLASGQDWDDDSVAALVQPISTRLPDLLQPAVNLADYDQLLSQGAGSHVSA